MDYRILGLNKIFSEHKLLELKESRSSVISILSYFATSLFDKDKVDEVLWDITENCISRLGLEDCVIYLLDENDKVLIQKAAYGNKNKGQRKILSPINIPVGEGIVGYVAQSTTPEIVQDTTHDKRYILDDIKRKSELCVPMILDKKVIGVIDSEHSKKSFFNETHLLLFELIALLTVKKIEHLKEQPRGPFTNDNAYFKQFFRLLDKEKIFKDETLTLTKVAESLNISANYLSQLINTLSDSNFSKLINRYRVEEAMACLKKPDFTNYTVAAIGYESGFNSTSAFYNAFKEHTGITPAKYKEKYLF